MRPWMIGCEESGKVRDAMIARGIPAVSCDLLPSRSDAGPHIQGDILDAIPSREWGGIVCFPDCTYLTCSAEWAYSDGPYHQRVKPGTLVGAERRSARERAIAFAQHLWNSMDRVILENPVGVLSRVLGRPQVIQPYMFGDDASKATCIWIKGLPPLTIPPKSAWFQPRIINGKPRWANQTDSGQNRLSPGPDRKRDRSETYPGIAAVLADLIATAERTPHDR